MPTPADPEFLDALKLLQERRAQRIGPVEKRSPLPKFASLMEKAELPPPRPAPRANAVVDLDEDLWVTVGDLP